MASNPFIMKSIVLISWIVCTATVGRAAEVPVVGSPGAPLGVEIATACPTFHWGLVTGAEGHELVVYRLTADGDEAEALLRKRFKAPIDGWTLSSGDCLERGGRYAWAVRALGAEGESPWSAPNLFRVARGPSEAELERALQVVRDYFAATEAEGEPEAPAEVPRQAAAPAAEPRPARRGRAAAAVPRSHAGSGGAIVVDGAMAETKADPPCFPSLGDADAVDRFIDCGNGTVHDTNTGLLWLQDASCTSEMLWHDASAFAAALADEQCGLTDHSQAGDWRLPTLAEWESIFRPCTEPPDIAGRDGWCWADDPSNAWATGLVSTQGEPYWSSTSDHPPAYAWTVELRSAAVSSDQKVVHLLWVWPVRDGT